MREILFRGKTSKGEWIYGFYMNKGVKDIIVDTTRGSLGFGLEVDGETVGQYTGLNDKNGNKIFEGDIVKVVYIENRQYQGVVYSDEHTWVEEIIYSEENACYMLKLMCDDIPMYRPLHNFENLARIKDVEVIGNIYDNKNLLEEKL